RIAGENRHGVAKDFVVGELAAAIVVVVECGQIVVNQRIGVDQFEGTGCGDYAGIFVSGRARGFDAKDRADALTAGKETVAHGAVNRGGRRRLGGDQPLEFSVDELLLMRQVFAQIHVEDFSGRKGSATILPSRRISISTRVSACSSCLRQASLRLM